MRLSVLAAVAAVGFSFASEALAGDISPQANREFLAAYSKKTDIVKRPSGLMYRIIKSGAGTGESPLATDTVRVAYKGSLVDGYIFEQTRTGETKDLPAGQVISGWKEALTLMKEGDEWELVIPSALAYGENRTEAVPSNQTLIFDMQLVGVVKPKR